ncbi:molybdenum cofactor synthesis domain protein [Solidesulfovibrio carbinoliphilus subsp. oakridgensis]|uniref:Molybdopterin molybdenumtransferase n=1 Tax=Solidesulfovibrio carbinoliphilus subsp. oakridgensis TaxID=694327 RepID=G7Q6W8_9BACT|nr:gephyrin-like molybdotransferase Glp [Solidesulfovibrio carbinoliphilus]EHJ48451.1 molybdenum cofactor synthesis domain protein [Solidesulfovibrio carbinoliphilus subsp. oakridgensis]
MREGFFRAVSTAEFTDLLRTFPVLPSETVDLDEALGRFLAGDLVAAEDLPAAARAAMDGYAVRAADVFGATESNPAYLDLAMDIPIGVSPEKPLPPGHCARIVTGALLPDGADAVVMVEYTEDLGAGAIEIRRPLAPGENMLLAGEDAAKGQRLLAAGTKLRPQEIGILAALGHVRVAVGRRPRAAVLSTGDELVPAGATPKPGQIRDVNTHTLSAMLRAAGAASTAFPLVRDDLAGIQAALAEAVADHDLTLLSGGSSVGARDFTLDALRNLGADILAHGVALSPGKPTILARLHGKPVIGLPGQVTSAQIVLLVFGLPLLAHLAGDTEAFDRPRPAFPALLSRNVASRQGREDHVRVRLEPRPGQIPLAHPVLGKSGLLKTLLLADGLITIPADLEGLAGGAEVAVRPV